MAGGIMKSYITGVILEVAIFNAIHINVVFWEGVNERQGKSNHWWREFLLIRVSRGLAPDRAVQITVFADFRAAGTVIFLCVEIKL